MNYLRVFLIATVVAILSNIIPSVIIAVTAMALTYYMVTGVHGYGLTEPATYLLVALLAAFVF